MVAVTRELARYAVASRFEDLPEAVRHEQAGWRERLSVRALPFSGTPPKLTKRQQEIWNIIEERRELPLKELLELARVRAPEPVLVRGAKPKMELLRVSVLAGDSISESLVSHRVAQALGCMR